MHHTRTHLVALLFGAFIALHSAPAAATCLMQCQAELVLEGCEPVDATAWPPWMKFQAAITCETCCSPPGGPSNCSESEADPGSLVVTQGGEDVGGSFLGIADMCPDATVFQYTPHLDPGDYQLLTSQSGFNEILAQFTVLKPECATDADCQSCHACQADGCTWTGTPACLTDADCPEGELCWVDEDTPCNNGCGDPPPPPCETDDDCGPCAGCSEGECHVMPGLPPECGDDNDCEGGAVCVIDECSAYCESAPECPGGPECPDTADSDATTQDAMVDDVTTADIGPEPEADVVTPEADVVTPEADVVTPEADVVTPEADTAAPPEDLTSEEGDDATTGGPGASTDDTGTGTQPGGDGSDTGSTEAGGGEDSGSASTPDAPVSSEAGGCASTPHRGPPPLVLLMVVGLLALVRRRRVA
jgi:uncharacterized protein (TIGR03382 family)